MGSLKSVKWTVTVTASVTASVTAAATVSEQQAGSDFN